MGKENIISETVTENIFRNFYGHGTFIEKSHIPKSCKFLSKNGTKKSGYPDFFLDMDDIVFVVEAKPLDHALAQKEIKHYMNFNNIKKTIIGIAISGQNESQMKCSYYYKLLDSDTITELKVSDNLLPIDEIVKNFLRQKDGEYISEEKLINTLKSINKEIHEYVRDTNRSLFFSGIMIALKDNNFRNLYDRILPPSKEEKARTQAKVIDARNLNESLLTSITDQLNLRVNNLSKEYNWRDKFAFIRNIDIPLDKYKEIISKIEKDVYASYALDEKQDLLGKAYKIFLSRAGKYENKNIILTPDHIKKLMIKLARLSSNDVVLDTCLGSGGFLMEAMERMIHICKNDPKQVEDIKENRLIGFEKDEVLFSLSCSNMFLHGDGRTNLLYRSSLLNKKTGGFYSSDDEIVFNYIKSLKPNKVIINPPYEKDLPIQFIWQAIQFLEVGGVLIVIAPKFILNKHKEKGGFLEMILKEAKLDFVVSMPDNLFSEQGRTISTAIYGFTKTPHHENDRVLFYNLKDDGFKSIQHKGKIDVDNKWNNIEAHVIDVVSNSLEIKNVSQKKLIFNDGIVNPLGYSDSNDFDGMVRIGDVFDLENGTLASTKGDSSGSYPFITASETWSTHTDYTEDKEALIMAVGASGSLGRTHYINGKFVASNLCIIMTPKEDCVGKINMQFYKYYFDKIRKQLADELKGGSSKKTIKMGDLEDFYIKLFPKDIQDNIVKKHIEAVESLEDRLSKAKKSLSNKLNEIYDM